MNRMGKDLEESTIAQLVDCWTCMVKGYRFESHILCCVLEQDFLA